MPPDTRPLPLAAAVGVAFAARWARVAPGRVAGDNARAAVPGNPCGGAEDGDAGGDVPLPDAPPSAAFAYVDGFAGDDLRRGGSLADARALHVLRAVEAGTTARGGSLAAVLVEEDPAVAVRLADALRAAGADVRLADALPASISPGERWVVRGAFRDHAAGLAHLANASATLVVLMPPAAGQLPLAAAAPLLACPGADVLVGLPETDFMRVAATRGALADLPPLLRRALDGCAALLGDAPAAWLPALREATDARASARGRCAEAFLRATGRTPVPVGVRDGTGGGASLLLLADRARHALALNDAIRVVGGGRVPAEADAAAPLRPPARDLFGEPVTSPEDGFDAAALARELAEVFRGRNVAAGAVMARAAKAGAGADDLRAAVARLRREGALRLPSAWDEDAPAEFPRTAAPARRVRPPSPAPDGDLPLFAHADAEGRLRSRKRGGGRARRTPPPDIRSPAVKAQGRWSTPHALK